MEGDSKSKTEGGRHHKQKHEDSYDERDDDLAHKALTTLVHRKLSTAEELGMVPLNKPVTLRTSTDTYVIESVIGSGSFGAVLKGYCDDEAKTPIALKRVLQDRRYKNRELQTLKLLNHSCVVKLLNSFYSQATPTSDVFLNVVMDYLPTNLHDAVRYYTQRHEIIPLVLAKAFSFQMFRGLAYIHSIGITHRDLKPHNILCSLETGELRICDFGSAKTLRPDEPSVAYICSRFYRAPELIFNSVHYTNAIDMWSVGCIIAELFLGRPLFTGDSNPKQIQIIMRVLGSPTREQIVAMNKDYVIRSLPVIPRAPWTKVFRVMPDQGAISIIEGLLKYAPNERATAAQMLLHPWFSALSKRSLKLPDGNSLPRSLLEYSKEELDLVASLGSAGSLPVRKHHHKHHKHRRGSSFSSPGIEPTVCSPAFDPMTPVSPKGLSVPQDGSKPVEPPPTEFALDAPAPSGTTDAKPDGDSSTGKSSTHKNRKTKRNLCIVPVNTAVGSVEVSSLTSPVQHMTSSSLLASEKF